MYFQISLSGNKYLKDYAVKSLQCSDLQKEYINPYITENHKM